MPLAGAFEPLAAVPPPPRAPTLLTLGTMSWFGVEEGILWLAREVWPLVRQNLPAATWDLAGAHPGPAVQALDGRDGIRVLGRLDDVPAAFAEARVVAVPLSIAAGMRVKILDALAAGRPVVATALGAAGFARDADQGVLTADDPATFARHVTALMTDDALWTSATRNGLEHVRGAHSPERTAGHLAEVFGRLIRPTDV
jgi:glycosyltransferase involved in cell wall biosynthesis